MIQVTAEQQERVSLILHNIPGGVEKAMNNAINRGLEKARTEASRKVSEVYAIAQKDIRAEGNVSLRKASGSGMAGEISYSGTKIPMFRFNASPRRSGTGAVVSAALMRSNAPTIFESAFVATMKSGHTGIFERTTAKRFPIEEKMGLAVAQMVGNIDVTEHVEKEAQETIDKRLEHEIGHILDQSGG